MKQWKLRQLNSNAIKTEHPRKEQYETKWTDKLLLVKNYRKEIEW